MRDFFSRRQRKRSNFIPLLAREKKSHVFHGCAEVKSIEAGRYKTRAVKRR
jgi:hypothetical protein